MANECDHVPDWNTLAPVRGEAIVDVACSRCGMSGSIGLSATDVLWETNEENEEDNDGRPD